MNNIYLVFFLSTFTSTQATVKMKKNSAQAPVMKKVSI